jgi:pimeloyl-ACP methyl ester carboxylesterase
MPLQATASGPIWYADHRDPTLHRPVTVLVHGAGGSHLDWPAELRRLPEANAIALDLPGHGRSPGAGRNAVAAYAADVIALMDALKLKTAVVAGHSMGGAVAQTVALNYPDRISGVLLVATGAKLTVHPDILKGILNDYPKTVDLIVNWYYGSIGSDTMRRTSRRRLLEFDPPVVHGDYTACNAFDLRNRVSQIRQPTLIVGGTEDKLTPLKYSEFLRDQILGSQLVKVEGAGHMLMIEQPEFVADSVRRWLLENT